MPAVRSDEASISTPESERRKILDCVEALDARVVQELEGGLSLGSCEPTEVLSASRNFLQKGKQAAAYAAADLVCQYPGECPLAELVEAHGLALISTGAFRAENLGALHFKTIDDLLLPGLNKLRNPAGMIEFGQDFRPDSDLVGGLHSAASLFHRLAADPSYTREFRQMNVDLACLYYANEMVASGFMQGGIPDDLVKLVEKEGFDQPLAMRR